MFYSYILMQIRSFRVLVIIFLSLLWGKNCADLFIGLFFFSTKLHDKSENKFLKIIKRYNNRINRNAAVLE